MIRLIGGGCLDPLQSGKRPLPVLGRSRSRHKDRKKEALVHVLVAHGGAGRWPSDRSVNALAELGRAAEAGRKHLAQGGSALEAVVAAVETLEDALSFNAGTGANLTLDGRAELDAGVMEGKGLATGNVGAIEGVRHPIRVAQKVLEETDHVLLTGRGACHFARAFGFSHYDPVTEAARERWRRLRKALSTNDDSPSSWALRRLKSEPGGDTVGAVARDEGGQLAAATSTGGTMLKLPGRIGDSPLPGAGNYADAHCAISATGRGELMIRFGTAHALANRIQAGHATQMATEAILTTMEARLGKEAGLIAVDWQGRIGLDHRTSEMPFAITGSAEVASHHGMRVE